MSVPAPAVSGPRDRALSSPRTPASVPVLDGFRGLAVLWIVLGHCWNELGGRIPLDGGVLRHIFVSSYMGVDMLFIVSGFVLFLPVVIDGTIGDPKCYAVRRAARIVPAFYAALVLSYAVALLVDAPRLGTGGWLSHLLFLHTESHNVSKVGFGVNGAMWTMSVEVLFYIALPLVAGWYRRRPFLGLALAAAGAELWHQLTLNLPSLVANTGIAWSGADEAQLRMALAFPGYLPQFAVGMTAAWLFVRMREQRERLAGHAVVAQIAALTGALAIAYLRGWEGARGTSGPLDHWVKTADRTFFFGVLVLATALATSGAQWPVRNAVSRGLGRICYGTYLTHLPLIALMIPALGLDVRTTSNAQFLLLATVVVPLSVLAGAISYRYLEQPFRRWARRAPRRSSAETQEMPRIALLPSRA
jgi:peptidoglycan/LPS O-acetylase OafA/YrhL